MFKSNSRSTQSKTSSGFTLLELIASMAIMMVISAAAFSAINFYQKSFVSTEARVDTVAQMRNAITLIAQEVEQSGSMGFVPTTLSSAVTAGATTMTVVDASGMYPGETITVDTQSTTENVTIAANGISGNTVTLTTGFVSAHANGAAVYVDGVIAQAIIQSSTASVLKLVGDINGDGKIVYVEYTCDPTTNHTLTRSITPVSAANKTAAVVLIQNLQPNPNIPGSSPATPFPCFSYDRPDDTNLYQFYSNVAVQVSALPQGTDPFVMGSNNMTLRTFDILNLAPRNVVAGRAIVALTNPSPMIQAVPPIPN